MNKNVILMAVKPYIGDKNLITFKSHLDKLNDEKAQEFVRKIPAINGLKNPIVALILSFLCLGLGRIYIKSFGFLAVELFLILSLIISTISINESNKENLAILFFASLICLPVYAMIDIFTIMGHTREKNLAILLDELA